MADIFITDANGSPLETLNSEDETTVGELFDVIGIGTLRMGGVLKAKKELVLTAGTYAFVPSRQETPPSSPGKIPANVIDLLESVKGQPLTTQEIDYVLLDFGRHVDQISHASDERKRKQLANSLWIRLSARIRTGTRLKIREQYLFNGPVPGATTALGTEIQFVFKGSSLFCAKIMQNIEALEREYQTAVEIHTGQACSTVMAPIEFIHIPGETARAAMITPYYPLTLAVVSNGLLHLEGIINAALCGVATLKAFNVKRFCHGDIKPANMMFCACAKTVVMIDFGSVSAYGERLTSATPQFGLDHPPTASLVYDLTCLATSLFVISTGKPPPGSIQELKSILEAKESEDRTHPALQIALRCLNSPADVDRIWIDARGYVDKYLPHLDQQLLVLYDEIWPTENKIS